MAFLATKVLSSMSMARTPILEVSTHCWSKVSDLSKRLCSTRSAPFQTPSIEDPQWKGMLKNIEIFNNHPPLSLAEIKRDQQMYETERRLAQMKDMLSEVMKSNERLHGKIHHVIELLTK